MLRLLTILCMYALLGVGAGRAVAQPSTDSAVTALVAQNPLLAQVARVDKDALWDLVKRLQLIVVSPARDAGSSRGANPSTAESADIAANPVFAEAYRKDRGATLDALRAAYEELRRARQQSARDFPQRLALVVGSGENRAWGLLSTTTNDANLIANTLRETGFTLFGGRALLNPDRPTLEEAIRDFSSRIGPNTVALFYFAGHGMDNGEDNYLVPSDAPLPRGPADPYRELVSVENTVLPDMQRAGGRLNIVILDACRDNPVPPSFMLAMRGAHQQYVGLGTSSATSNMRGTIVIYSAAPHKAAWDLVNIGDADSPFASVLAKAMIEPGLEMRDMFKQVHDKVMDLTHKSQEPWIMYGVSGYFYFVRPSRTDVVIPSVPGLSLLGPTDSDRAAPEKANASLTPRFYKDAIDSQSPAVLSYDDVSRRLFMAFDGQRLLLADIIANYPNFTAFEQSPAFLELRKKIEQTRGSIHCLTVPYGNGDYRCVLAPEGHKDSGYDIGEWAVAAGVARALGSAPSSYARAEDKASADRIGNWR